MYVCIQVRTLLDAIDVSACSSGVCLALVANFCPVATQPRSMTLYRTGLYECLERNRACNSSGYYTLAILPSLLAANHASGRT